MLTFVGSSRMRNVGDTKRARAREMRMRQPPEKSRVRLACISLSKPSPCRSDAARDSVVSESSRSSLHVAFEVRITEPNKSW